TSEYTRCVLTRCREIGCKMVYATGRGESFAHVAPQECFDGKITMNGAVAVIDGNAVYNCLIPYELARPVLMACDRRGLKAAAELGGMHYANFSVSDEWPDFPGTSDCEVVDFAHHALGAEKLYMVIKNPDDAAFIRAHLPKELYLCATRDGFCMVMHVGATKAKAIAELARIWGIERQEIAAFGDDINDIDMLTYAGIGIAMGNAVDEVKAVADAHCQCNNNDGAARWLEQNVLERMNHHV
ncbi:MAG: HAD family hydrolase, partial [Oscillospiraceae bacterium]|nr:HAD family hydrolase [Oscillospiraceae bacterium]